ncbi:glycosyltransferase family 87 protein [Halorhabdus sp. BNX81]|uniref:glycosyltransferase family 87 protein n=1 Tax=Halorhabdus sp. BNX81 TaxID=2980181 RepID=UPI0023DD5AB1|nr:glycosyltransferase family 87 protein [Halorhabdus sp. BNX81]WEL22815.1 putative membrane protein [Halorhabdus sp. BNX81]
MALPNSIPSVGGGDRPSGRWWVRLSLVVGLLAGLTAVISMAVVRPAQFSVATDVYARAGRAMLDGEAVYAVSPTGTPGFTFKYPPVVAVLSIGYGLIGPTAAYVTQVGVNLLALGTLAWLVLDRLPTKSRIDRRLAALAILAAGPVTSTFVMGQISPVVALCVGGGFLVALTDRAWRGGVGFGLGALIKVYPGGTWAWLFARRSWRALAVAIGVLAVGWLGNLVVGIELTQSYVTTVLFEESSTAVFAGGPPLRPAHVTVMRPLSALGVSGPWLWIGAAGLLGPPVLACYRRLDEPAGAETAFLATVIGLLAVVPLEWFYFTLAVAPLVLVAYRIENHPAVRVLAIGTILLWLAIPPEPLLMMTSDLPAGLGGAATWLATDVLRRIQPPLIGACLVLGACVWVQHDLARGRAVCRRTADEETSFTPD